jgi:glycosyltransferase involved in cell wall biosynthesis
MSALTIGVAIPCYKGHIEVLRYLLDSIETQTRKPDKVVVSCSSCESSDIPSSYFQYSFPLSILTWSEKRNVSQNRNIAISNLNTDIVTFIDADDFMHPQRLEVIEQCFLKHDVQMLLHFYETNLKRDFLHYSDFPFELNKLYVCPWRSVQHANYLRANIIHNGQASVRRAVLDRVRFQEGPEFTGREDTFFVGDVLLTYPGKSAYCPLRLSKYNPSRTFQDFLNENQIKELERLDVSNGIQEAIPITYI